MNTYKNIECSEIVWLRTVNIFGSLLGTECIAFSYSSVIFISFIAVRTGQQATISDEQSWDNFVTYILMQIAIKKDLEVKLKKPVNL